MSADVLAPAILLYLTENQYPESESVFSSTLSESSLNELLQGLKKEQDAVKAEIRSLSQSVAPDIDSWIAQAKELQADILRSRETARQIVADAEAGKKLRAEVEDQAKKVELLEKEVDFNDGLTGTLEHIRHANGLLDRAQEEAIAANVKQCLNSLEDAESSIAALDGFAGSRAVDALRQRESQLREHMKETTREAWDAFVTVNAEERWVKIQPSTKPTILAGGQESKLSFDSIADAAKGLGMFDALVQKLAKDIEQAILRPRMNLNDEQVVAKVELDGGELRCAGMSPDVDLKSLFDDLQRIVDHLSSHLPHSVAVPLSSHLVPSMAARLEKYWLDPAIPVSMKGIPAFQDVLSRVTDLANHIGSLGWSGADQLQKWCESAPRSWLTKRREAVLGEVRNLVFEGLRDRKVVERVETRVVSKEDMGMAASDATQGSGGDDDWDTAWDEPESSTRSSAVNVDEPSSNDGADDDDASAWDIDDDDPMKEPDATDAGDEGDAWGWGDDDQKASSPVAASKAQPIAKTAAPNGAPGDQQEMTLRETFTISAIPEGILTILQQIVSDAQALSGPQYADSPLAPASTALYTIPTLALAIYRATAPTAYAKVDGVGNMLIYNDTSRLADQLRDWQAHQPPHSRLRIDNDVSALESFAKRAYASEMDAQRTVLTDLLDGAQGFANCTEQPFKQECESAVDATVDRIRDVHKMWHGILSHGALLQSLGSLLGTVTGKMINEIEDLGDISEADSKQLKLLCDRVLTLKDLFTQPSPQPQAGEEQQDMTFIYCPTWLKFQYLAEILESSLADIKWMWKEGELLLEFSVEEVVELVEALFAESELRRGAVREIRGGRR